MIFFKYNYRDSMDISAKLKYKKIQALWITLIIEINEDSV